MDPITDPATAFFDKYVKGPGLDSITDTRLLHHLVDFGVSSGPTVAIKRLQKVLGVEEDGKFDLHTLDNHDLKAINNKLVAERIRLLANFCVKNPSQLKFLNGWVDRALEFLI